MPEVSRRGRYLLEEQSCQFSSRSHLKRRSLTLFDRASPHKKKKTKMSCDMDSVSGPQIQARPIWLYSHFSHIERNDLCLVSWFICEANCWLDETLQLLRIVRFPLLRQLNEYGIVHFHHSPFHLSLLLIPAGSINIIGPTWFSSWTGRDWLLFYIILSHLITANLILFVIVNYHYFTYLSATKDDYWAVCHIVSYHIVDLKRQNRLKVGTDKP